MTSTHANTAHWSERFATLREAARVLAGTPLADSRSEEEVLICLLAGDELGSGPVESLSKLYVRNGRIEARADFLRALCERRGVKVTVTTGEGDDPWATVDVRRSDATGGAVTWSMDDAKCKAIANTECFRSHPVAVLIARASAEAVRSHVPEILGPICHTSEEGAEIGRIMSRSVRVQRSDSVPGKDRVSQPIASSTPEVPNPVREPDTEPRIPSGWSSTREADKAHRFLIAEARALPKEHPVALRLAEVTSNKALMDRERFVAARRAVAAALSETRGLDKLDTAVDTGRKDSVTHTTGTSPASSSAVAASVTPLAMRVSALAARMDRGKRCV
ncbi:MAG: hypothetical protein ACYDEY_14675 [Acidimicrobiales bacterium]